MTKKKKIVEVDVDAANQDETQPRNDVAELVAVALDAKPDEVALWVAQATDKGMELLPYLRTLILRDAPSTGRDALVAFHGAAPAVDA